MSDYLREFVDNLHTIQGLQEHCVGYGYGGDPYLHLHYKETGHTIGVCAYNVSIKEETPQELIDQIPLWVDCHKKEPVMVHICRNDGDGWREVRRRLYTGEVIDTPDWGQLLGLK